MLMFASFMLVLTVLEGTNPASCFPHSTIGYEACCYSCIWSKSLAKIWLAVLLSIVCILLTRYDDLVLSWIWLVLFGTENCLFLKLYWFCRFLLLIYMLPSFMMVDPTPKYPTIIVGCSSAKKVKYNLCPSILNVLLQQPFWSLLLESHIVEVLI